MSQYREEALFAAPLGRPPAERAVFLDGACHGDPALRQRLEALLAAHEQPDTLLATQAETARPTFKLDLADAPDDAVGQTLGRNKLLEKDRRGRLRRGVCRRADRAGAPARGADGSSQHRQGARCGHHWRPRK